MTEEEKAAQRKKALVLLGVGVVALLCSYGVGYAGPRSSVSVLTEMVLTAIFLGCLFVAAMTVLKLNKEKASK
jgi:hypothetical protein